MKTSITSLRGKQEGEVTKIGLILCLFVFLFTIVLMVMDSYFFMSWSGQMHLT